MIRPKLAALAAGVTILTAGCGGSPATALESAAATMEFTMNGDFTLYDYPSTLNDCEGINGYNDIGYGTDVTITAADSTKIAVGRLNSGEVIAGNCVYDFVIEHVPAGAKFYGIEVSHRGPVSYTEAEVRDFPRVSLGDDE